MLENQLFLERLARGLAPGGGRCSELSSEIPLFQVKFNQIIFIVPTSGVVISKVCILLSKSYVNSARAAILAA